MKKRIIPLLIAVVFVLGVSVLRYSGGPNLPPYPPRYYVYNTTLSTSTNL